MLTPQQLEAIQNNSNIVLAYQETELTLIKRMSSDIARLCKITDGAKYRYERLLAINSMPGYIIQEMAKTLNMSQKDLKKLFEDAGTETLKYDDSIYREWGLNPTNINNSPALLQILNAGLAKTNGLFKNLTKTTARTATQYFENILDKAYNEIMSGAFTYQDSIKRAIKDLSANGIPTITYPSNHTDYIDVATRRATLTGISQTCGELQMARTTEMGVECMETSSHAGARNTGEGYLNHAEWQGKQFLLVGSEPNYPNYYEACGYGYGGGIYGWNCKHQAYPCKKGDKTARTKKELEELNNRTVTYKDKNGNNVTVSEYEGRQKQRSIERKIRQYKRESAANEAAGIDNTQAKAKIREWQKTQREFISQTGLRRDYFRERAGKQNV